MILFRKSETKDPSLMPGTNMDKKWTYIGNGKEVIAKKISPAKDAVVEENVVVPSTKKDGVFEQGDIAYYNGKWVQIEGAKEGKVTLKIDEKLIEVGQTECTKDIPIKVLLSDLSSQQVFLLDANGRITLQKLAPKLCKKGGIKPKKGEWYYNGKKVEETTTIESLAMKPGDKLACFMLGYDIKTFKRFPKLDESRGWYMSTSSKDSISFVPQKPIMIFGFGMYYTREGPPSYTMTYEMYLNEELKKTGTLTVTKPGDEQIMQIYFTPDRDPIPVAAETIISISVKYDSFDNASRLIVGDDGGNFENIDTNEHGLFKVESHRDSGNGTGTSAGQIPELYYGKE